MVIVINGNRMVSEIKEKVLAHSDYSKAKSEHKTTCLLEKNNNGSYKVNLGNIQPDKEIIVELTYITILEYSSGVVKFVLPTNIGQKYDGSLNKTVKDILFPVSQSLTYSNSQSYSFSFNINYKSHNVINSVKSQTNEIKVTSVLGEELFPKEVNVTSTSMPSSGDFNLLIDTVIAPGIYYNTQGETTYLAVTHKIPDQSLDIMSVQKEFIFVIDRSGSMRNEMNAWSSGGKSKMELAKEALQLFINSLPPKSTFNVYSFGNNFNSLFPSSVLVTNETIKFALEKISLFEANMGGTEIFDCLKTILSKSSVTSSNKNIVDLSKRLWKFDAESDYEKIEKTNSNVLPEKVLILLTDGQVTNYDAVIGLCEEYNYLSRIFCVGIGSDADRGLLTGISFASNGYSEMLVDNDDISGAVVKMLDMSLKSFYKFMGITINGERSTEHVLYPNQSLSFFKVMPTDMFNKLTEVTISGINGLSGEIQTWIVPVTSVSKSPKYLRQLWANDKIQSYLENNNRNKFTNEIIKLSVEHSVATKYTSFIVIDEVVHSNQSENSMHINIPQYGDSIQKNNNNLLINSSYYSMRAGAFKTKKSTQYDCEEDLESVSQTLNIKSNGFQQRYDECERAPVKNFNYSSNSFTTQSNDSNNLNYLLNFKNVDGSFKYDEKILKTIGVSLDKFKFVVVTQKVSQNYLLNMLVLAYIKSFNDNKYTIIQKMVESWLDANKSIEVLESVLKELFA